MAEPRKMELITPATRYRILVGAGPDGGVDLWLYLVCIGGPNDGSAVPCPISREQATTLLPVLKAWAENGEML